MFRQLLGKANTIDMEYNDFIDFLETGKSPSTDDSQPSTSSSSSLSSSSSELLPPTARNTLASSRSSPLFTSNFTAQDENPVIITMVHP